MKTTSQREKFLIIFDVDGTLANTFKIGHSLTNKVLAEQGYSENQITADQYMNGTKLVKSFILFYFILFYFILFY